MFTKQLGRIAAILLASMIVTSTVFAAALSSSWPSAGHDLNNTRNQSSESKINTSNVGNLTERWQLTTTGDVSATPSIDGTNAYFPDKGGTLWAVNKQTGAVLWSRKISDYTGLLRDYARDTPAIFGNELILGDQASYATFGVSAPASVFAVNKQTGALIWKTVVDSGTFPIVTQSAVIDQSTSTPVAYIGVASAEEGYVAFGAPCCSFRGSMLALNALTGQILWKTYTVPTGYTGGSVWGSTAVIDYNRNSIYIGTGNNYSLPAAVQTCVANAGNNTAAQQACISPDDHFDSVMSLDMHTGAIKWASVAIAFDAWNVACVFSFINPGACPQPAGPDYDFGQGPTLYTVNQNGNNQDGNSQGEQLLGAGQKSGQYWAFNPDTGAVVWSTQVGPGGTLGGMEWGSAMDGKRIYVSIGNSEHKTWTLQNNQSVTWGGWAALDPATGKILWQTTDPLSAIDPGAVSVANGVVYVCSMDPQGHMYALDAASGNQLWSFASGGSCNAGASISNGMVYWGSGYGLFGTPNNQFYAFGLP